MSPVSILVLLILGIAMAIFIGSKGNMNYGMAAFAIAYVVGTFILGYGPNILLAHFPTSVLFTIIGTTYFYGFAVENGTVSVIADRLIYASRKAPWSLPLLLGVAAWSVGALGATAATAVMLVAPIGYQVAKRANFSTLLAVIVIGEMAGSGNMMHWSSIGSIYRGLIETIMEPDLAYATSAGFGAALLIMCAVISVAAYFIFKGYQAEQITIKKPEPITSNQKKTLAVIAVVLALVIVPRILNSLFNINGAVISWLIQYMDMSYLCILASIVLALLKVGDEKKAFGSIPWGLCILIAGFAVLLGVAIEGGAMEYLSNVIAEYAPDWLIVPLFNLVGGIMSFFMTGTTVVQTFTPLIPTVAASTGISASAAWIALAVGTNIAGMAPFSMGGSFILGLCPDPEQQKKQFGQQVILAIVTVLFSFCCGLLGFFNLFG